MVILGEECWGYNGVLGVKKVLWGVGGRKGVEGGGRGVGGIMMCLGVKRVSGV